MSLFLFIFFDTRGRKPAAAVLFAALTFVTGRSMASSEMDVLRIESAQGEIVSTYDPARLQRDFTAHERETATPWTDGPFRFRGPLLKDILERNGVESARGVQLRGYDGFMATITAAEIETYSPILAVEQACIEADRASGQCQPGQTYRPLTIDDSGPFYLVWPLEDLPSWYNPGRNAIWVWFVITVRPAP